MVALEAESFRDGIHLCVAAARHKLVRPARGHRYEVKRRDARRPRPEEFKAPRVLGVETVPVAKDAAHIRKFEAIDDGVRRALDGLREGISGFFEPLTLLE